MHDGKDFMFSVVVPLYLRAVGKELPHPRVFFASHGRFMGAHHGVQAPIQEHIEESFARWNRRNSSGYFSRERNPLHAARPLRTTGKPLDVAGLHPEIFLQEPSDPNRRRHVVFGKADSFPASCSPLTISLSLRTKRAE